uniref:Tuftelin 1 n=1 Tax=Pavo cristatus TaxID=9049 RepID=A0A8C9GAZ6_PAVCR
MVLICLALGELFQLGWSQSSALCVSQPVGKAFAMVANRSSNGHALASERIKSNDGDEEIIKVYLKARAEGSANHEEHVSQLKSEVRHIQEVSKTPRGLGCIATLCCAELCRPALANWLNPPALRALCPFVPLQRTVSQYREEAEQANCALRRAERSVVEKELQVDELQRLLAGMEKEHRTLLLKMKDSEAELARLRSVEGDKLAEQDRSAKLEKEVAMLREKIHHLDDMLKSQQRKVRQMIEQVNQAAQDPIQPAEHIQGWSIHNFPPSSTQLNKSFLSCSKRLMGPKPLPLIRVVET